MQWFRTYHGAPFHTKLALVARRANVTRGHAASIWWAVLDYASRSEPRGNVSGIDAEEIAAAFDYSEEEVIRALEAMRHKSLLIDESDNLTGWEEKQISKEDNTAAERKRRQREREKKSSHEMSRPVTKCHALDIDTEIEIEEKEVTNVTSKNEIVPREISPKQKSVTLDDLSVDHVAEWLAEKRSTGRFRDIDDHALLEKFKDYCLAKNPKYRDFVAAFRNSFGWESAPRTGKNNGSRQQKPTYHERIKAAGDAALEQIFADIDAEFEAGEGGSAEGTAGTELRRVPRLQPPTRGNSEHGQGHADGDGGRDTGGNQPSLPALDAGTFDPADTV